MTHPGGRPSEYKPCFCKDIIEHATNGGTVRSFPGYLYKHYGVAVTYVTLYEWAKKDEEFANAMDTASGISYYFYETVGIHGMTGQLKRVTSEIVMPDGRVKRRYKPVKFEYKAWIMIMVNKFGWRATERSGVDPEAPNPAASQGDSPLPPQVVLQLPDNGRDKSDV